MPNKKQREILDVICSKNGNPRLHAYMNMLLNVRNIDIRHALPCSVSIISLIKMPNTPESAPIVLRKLNDHFIKAFEVKAKQEGDTDAISHCIRLAKENGLNVKEGDVMGFLFGKGKDFSNSDIDLGVVLMKEMQADLRKLLIEFISSTTKRGDKRSASIKSYLQSMYYYMQPVHLGVNKSSTENKASETYHVASISFTRELINIMGVESFVAIINNGRTASKVKGLRGIDDVMGLTIKDAAHPTHLYSYSGKNSDADKSAHDFIVYNFPYVLDYIKQAYQGELNKAYAVLEKSLKVEIGTKVIGENYYNYREHTPYMNIKKAFVPCTGYLLAAMIFDGIREKQQIKQAA